MAKTSKTIIQTQKKKRKSVVVSFSISEETFDKFEEFFTENCIDKSKLIEKLILNHIKK